MNVDEAVSEDDKPAVKPTAVNSDSSRNAAESDEKHNKQERELKKVNKETLQKWKAEEKKIARKVEFYFDLVLKALVQEASGEVKVWLMAQLTELKKQLANIREKLNKQERKHKTETLGQLRAEEQDIADRVKACNLFLEMCPGNVEVMAKRTEKEKQLAKIRERIKEG